MQPDKEKTDLQLEPDDGVFVGQSPIDEEIEPKDRQ